jgi:hypothetical protein
MNMQTKPPHTAAEQAILDSFAEIIGQLPGDAKVTSARDKTGFSDFRDRPADPQGRELALYRSAQSAA